MKNPWKKSDSTDFFITLQSHIRKIASAWPYFDTEEISIYCPLFASTG